MVLEFSPVTLIDNDLFVSSAEISIAHVPAESSPNTVPIGVPTNATVPAFLSIPPLISHIADSLLASVRLAVMNP